MPKLDRRLMAVASLIRASVHVDVGSDHGHLLAALLASGRIARGIAIENKRQPFENSRRTLAGLDADVRFANGLEALSAGEANSLSLCGMGGEAMASILARHPDRVPPSVVLQPNRKPELVRRWARSNGFHLSDERVVPGDRAYQILLLRRADGADPAYRDVDEFAALLYGPLNLKRNEPWFRDRLQQEHRYLSRFETLGEQSRQRLAALDRHLPGDR